MQPLQKTSINNLLPILVIYSVLKTWLQKTFVSKHPTYKRCNIQRDTTTEDPQNKAWILALWQTCAPTHLCHCLHDLALPVSFWFNLLLHFTYSLVSSPAAVPPVLPRNPVGFVEDIMRQYTGKHLKISKWVTQMFAITVVSIQS